MEPSNGDFNRIKDFAKKSIKKQIIGTIIANIGIILKVILAVITALFITVLIEYAFETKAAEMTPVEINKQLQIEDIKELIEIKGNDNDGYHLEFVSDIDVKIESIINVLTKQSGLYVISKDDSDIIKKMIKAEAITQFPNLGGACENNDNEFQGAVKVRRITPDKALGELKNTGTGEVTTLGNEKQEEVVKEKDKKTYSANSLGTETIGDPDKIYVLAIAAGHNNTDNTGASYGEFVEQDMTIKVAEKVEELCKKYTNIKVVQTGSTSTNPGGISKESRVNLAKEASPDLCIQIHFNASENHGGSGVEAWYEYGDGYSESLAQILSKHMSNKMGLENRGAMTHEGNSDYYAIIDSSYQTKFPSVITEGGFLDNAKDQEVLKNGGMDKYAEAIVDGCIEYLTTDHSGESATFVQNTKEASGIASKVNDLKYVSKGKFEELVNADSKDALKYFTLDEKFNVITATWTSDGAKIDISNNTPFELRSSLQKVTMPYEYLLYFLIDSGNKDFVRQLAEMVADTEIIMAVQDNITTTQITAVVERKTNASVQEKVTGWAKDEDRSKQESSFLESCRTSISVTYADIWFVRYTRADESYSSHSLGVKKEEFINNKKINVKGKVTEQKSSEEKGYADDPYTVGDIKTGSYEIKVPIENSNPNTSVQQNRRPSNYLTGDSNENNIPTGNNSEQQTQQYEIKTIEYKYWTEERYRKSIHTISNTYEEGEPITEEKINKFINLYNEYKMANAVKEEWLFQILSKNTKTANMVDLTKFLLYKATDVSYGVEEFDFSEFDLSSFNNLNGYYGDWDGTGTKEDFINAVAPYAVADMEKNGIYASVTIAQAIIESGWGKDDIAINYKNFFGMKAFNTTPNEYWAGERVNLNASEGGTSYFRVYDSLRNSVFDHGRNFIVTSTYRSHGVLDCVSQNLGPKEQLRRIAISGYAVYRDGSISKPDGRRTYDVYLYEEFIIKYNLEKYDKMTSADFVSIGGNQEVISIAKSKLGSEYVWGAKGPNTFDCSGLVYWVYKQIGVNVPGSTSGYKSYKGSDKEISWDEAMPGDILIIFDYERSIGVGHAGIYLGNDEYIHSPQTGDVVKISSGAKKAFKHIFRFK